MITATIEISDGSLSITDCPDDFQLIIIDHDWDDGPITTTLTDRERQ